MTIQEELKKEIEKEFFTDRETGEVYEEYTDNDSEETAKEKLAIIKKAQRENRPQRYTAEEVKFILNYPDYVEIYTTM